MTYEQIMHIINKHGLDNTYLIHCFDTKDDGTPKPIKEVHLCKILSIEKEPFQTICFTGIETTEITRYIWSFEGIVSIEQEKI